MSQMMRRCEGLLIVALTVTALARAQEPVLPQPAAETHALDSLLGKWTFVEQLHNPEFPPQVKGIWTFSRGGDGFMVIDEFRAFNGSGGTVLLAETYRAYNPVKKTWSFQATIFQSPAFSPKSGDWDAGITRVQDDQVFDESNQGTTITRARFYNLKRESFSCVFETSNDSGRTWVNPIHLEAVRAKE